MDGELTAFLKRFAYADYLSVPAVIWNRSGTGVIPSDCAGFAVALAAFLAGRDEAVHFLGRTMDTSGLPLESFVYCGIVESNEIPFGSRGQWVVRLPSGEWAGLYADGVLVADKAIHLERSRAELVCRLEPRPGTLALEILEKNVARILLSMHPWQGLRPDSDSGTLVPVSDWPSLPPISLCSENI